MEPLMNVVSDKNLILFGTGSMSKRISQELVISNCNITCYTDNNRSKWGETFNQKRILPPSQLNINTDFILIASEYEDEIAEQLKKQEFEIHVNYGSATSLMVKEGEAYYCFPEKKLPSQLKIVNVDEIQLKKEKNILNEAYTFLCELPISMSQNQYPSFMIPQQQYPMSKINLYSFENGLTFGESGIILNQNGCLLKEFSTDNRLSLNVWDAQRVNIPKFENSFVVTLNNKIAVTTTQWSGINYYHWMFEELPRFYLLSKYNHSIDYYISNYASKKYQYETLQLMNIDEKKLIKSSNKYAIQATELLVPYSPSYDSGYVPSWICSFLNNLFDPYLKKDVEKYNTRIYIARGNALNRKVTNEQEIIQFLENQGFSIIYLEDYSVLEQANIFYNAEIIIGPHGAGLANLVFCQSGVKVLEIFNPMYAPIMFWNISSIRDLKYYCAVGERTDQYFNDMIDTYVNNKDIIIKIEDIKNFLNITS